MEHNSEPKSAGPKPPDFVSPARWIELGRGGEQFKTEASLEWFIRQNREALLDSGEFIPGRGARPGMLGPGFDALVVEILRRQSNPKSA